MIFGNTDCDCFDVVVVVYVYVCVGGLEVGFGQPPKFQQFEVLSGYIGLYPLSIHVYL